MINSKGEIFLLFFYWIIVMITAQIPRGPTYGLDNELIRREDSFSRKNRIGIFLLCLTAMVLHACFWDYVNVIVVPIIVFSYQSILPIVLDVCLANGCLGWLLILFFVQMAIAFTFFCFFFLPGKLIQLIGLGITGGAE